MVRLRMKEDIVTALSQVCHETNMSFVKLWCRVNIWKTGRALVSITNKDALVTVCCSSNISRSINQLSLSIRTWPSEISKISLTTLTPDSKLFGGIAVFKVGGATEAEVGKRKERVTDALNATRAAVEEGIVPGSGVSLLYAPKVLENLGTSYGDQKRGVEIINNALKAPKFTIASNAGVDDSVAVGKLLEQGGANLGYDAAKGEYMDMVKAGIIDPLKIIRTALVDSASVSLLLATTEATIVDNSEAKR